MQYLAETSITNEECKCSGNYSHYSLPFTQVTAVNQCNLDAESVQLLDSFDPRALASPVL